MGGGPIRILYQFATAKAKTDLGMAEVERRRRFLNARVGPGVTVDVGVPERGEVVTLG